MIPMIIDTDPGVDDAMAIAYALSHPDIELLALTTVFGNTHLEATTRNACWLLDQFGAASVDVARGAALPMAQGPLPHAEFVHGADGVGNAYPSEPVVLNPSARHARIQESSAAEYIVSAARARPGEIALVLGTEPCCAMHDAAAVACVVMPDAFDYVTGPARVVPDGMASGQLLLDRKGYAYATPWWEDRPATVVCTAVDSERVRADFMTRLVSGEILA